MPSYLSLSAAAWLFAEFWLHACTRLNPFKASVVGNPKFKAVIGKFGQIHFRQKRPKKRCARETKTRTPPSCHQYPTQNKRLSHVHTWAIAWTYRERCTHALWLDMPARQKRCQQQFHMPVSSSSTRWAFSVDCLIMPAFKIRSGHTFRGITGLRDLVPAAKGHQRTTRKTSQMLDNWPGMSVQPNLPEKTA